MSRRLNFVLEERYLCPTGTGEQDYCLVEMRKVGLEMGKRASPGVVLNVTWKLLILQASLLMWKQGEKQVQLEQIPSVE
jgi:hypothetical protein